MSQGWGFWGFGTVFGQRVERFNRRISGSRAGMQDWGMDVSYSGKTAVVSKSHYRLGCSIQERWKCVSRLCPWGIRTRKTGACTLEVVVGLLQHRYTV